ncbi:MAG: protein-disulfide isomerase, partial [Planctomycetes bacterium]|nr:protein-disulfide isomerase [Planctomycetota bacterium]
MPFNVYDPCPCGSGKKIKFCCQDIVDEMERIGRLADGNQPRVALQQLEKLNQKFPNRSWVVCTLAILNMESGEDQAALDHL